MNTLSSLLSLVMLAVTAAGAERPAVTMSVEPTSTEAPQVSVLPGFALIVAGEFLMGDAFGEMKDAPQHKVTVSAFYMQKKEVSKAEWDDVREWGLKHGYTDLAEGNGKAATHPVNSVTWYAAVKWCNARSEKEGLVPCYYTDSVQRDVYRKGNTNLADTMVKWSATGYRLPTEAEWEKAARGGLIGKRFPWGNTISHRAANFYNGGNEAYCIGTLGYHPAYTAGDEPYTSPVGSFPANGYGLFDVAGNVGEWCWDWKGTYPTEAETDSRGEDSGLSRVLRGGGWMAGIADCRVAFRSGNFPAESDSDLGFRVTRCPFTRMSKNAELHDPDLNNPPRTEPNEPGGLSSL